MSFLHSLYSKALTENEKHTLFWKHYLKNLQVLDFNIFSEKLKVPMLVPIGSRVFFRGELQHTNALTVSIGADYFVKCSINQAEILRQHRIRDAQSKVDALKREKEHLLNRLTFSKENLFENQGHEIIETFNDENEKLWKQKHRENVRQHKQGYTTIKKTVIEDTDEDLWDRLEELELQEELENELQNISSEPNNSNKKIMKSKSFIVNEETIYEKNDTENSVEISKTKQIKTPQKISKLDLLQQVLNKQNELENKLLELKNRETTQTKTENDLISKLDEMEKLDELEDDMNRLDDVLQSDAEESEEELSKSSSSEIKKAVSFADQDDSETLEITFKHSKMEPCMDPYDTENGILKPSDIYEAYSHLFASETTSILRKSNYENQQYENKILEPSNKITENLSEVNRTIVVQDIVEKNDLSKMNMDISESRPTSLFKLRRQNKK